MNLNPYISIWAVLALVVLAMAVYRTVVARRDDASLHVIENETLIAQQEKAYHTIETVDRWGQLLTIVTIFYGLVLATIHLYHVWQESAKIRVP